MFHINILFIALFISLFAQNNGHASQAQVDVNKKKIAEALISAPFEGEAGYTFIENAIQNNTIDINAQNTSGDTVLHYAISSASLDTIKLLLEKCPDINLNLKNHKGKTPVEYALQSMYQYIGNNWDAKFYAVQAILKLLVAANATCPDLTDPHCLDDKLWFDDDEFYAWVFLFKSKEAYVAGKQICEQRKKELAAYEHAAIQLQQHIPVKDLNDIIADYNTMSIVEYALTHKQADLQAAQK